MTPSRIHPVVRHAVVVPLLVASLLAGLPAVAPARADVSPAQVDAATKFIADLADHAIAILRRTDGTLAQREADFRKILSESFDLKFIGRFVLGRHWRKATEEQRADYQSLFTEWLLKTYSRRLGGYSGETFETISARPVEGGDILVRTRINRPSGPPIQADWRVRPEPDGMRIIDIMVEGVSMAVTQRSEFSAVVAKEGVDGLINILRARTQKLDMTS